MKLLFIGHSIIDNFVTETIPVIKPGGIYYNLAGIKSFFPESVEDISILTSVNENVYTLFRDVYDDFDISPSMRQEKIPEVKLVVEEKKEREEYYIETGTKLDLHKAEDLKKYDGIFINMITGMDITPEDLALIRQSTKSIIYMDVHTLARGMEPDGRRTFRKIPRVREWLENIDILQVNENELFTLSSFEKEKDICREVLGYGVKYLIVTRGALGATLYTMDGGEPVFYSVAGIKTDTVNKVGCGDIFGSVCFYMYIECGDFIYSLKKANFAAAMATSVSDVRELHRIKNDFDKYAD